MAPTYTLQSDNSYPGGVPETPFKVDESMSGKLDPKYVDFFNSVLSKEPSILYTHRLPLETTKKGGNVIPGQSKPQEMKKVIDMKLPSKHRLGMSIPVRVFIPKGNKPEKGWPLFIWFHGGGWVLGNINTENSYCTKVADYSGAIVMTVDYRLAPENPFPSAVEDAFDATIWAFEHASSELDVNKTNIALGGSSAGGNLTAVVTNKFVESDSCKDFPPIKYQVLVVPVIDNTATPETHLSWHENEFTPQLPAEKMLWYKSLYLPNPEDHKNPEASPIFYSDENISKLPSCFIAAAECDVLRTEAELYAEKLIKNNVETTLKIYKKVPHPVMVMDDILQQGKELIIDTTSSLKAAFSK